MFKKLKIVSGMMMVTLFVLSTNLFAQNYSGGFGTEEDPYYITSKTNLKYLSEKSGKWQNSRDEKTHFNEIKNTTQSARMSRVERNIYPKSFPS